MAQGWLTPGAMPSTTRQCVLEFPDSEEFQSLVLGALYLLSDEVNYEVFGALSAEETADAMRQTLFLFQEGDCVIVPTGACMDWPSNTIPSGWIDTNQGPVSRTTYANLYAVIGTTWGAGDGSTTFDLPHKDGRVTVGKKSGDADFDTLGETGGAKTHTLVIGEIPSHNHSEGTFDGGTPAALIVQSGTGANIKRLSQNSGNAGGGGAHNNLQPYVVMNYIIKI